MLVQFLVVAPVVLWAQIHLDQQLCQSSDSWSFLSRLSLWTELSSGLILFAGGLCSMHCHWLFIQLGLWKLGQFDSSHYYRYTTHGTLKSFWKRIWFIVYNYVGFACSCFTIGTVQTHRVILCKSKPSDLVLINKIVLHWYVIVAIIRLNCIPVPYFLGSSAF